MYDTEEWVRQPVLNSSNSYDWLPNPGFHLGGVRIPRIGWEEYFMLQAHLVATRSTCNRGPELLLCKGRCGVGAVIVKERMVISSGYNGSPPGSPHCCEMKCVSCNRVMGVDIPNDRSVEPKNCDFCGGLSTVLGGHLIREGHCVRTIHAEMNAIIQCAICGVSLKGAAIFCTASPCWDCAKAILRSGISSVYVGQDYESRYGLSSSAVEIFRSSSIPVSYVQISDDVR